MEGNEVLTVRVRDLGNDEFLNEICISCSPITLIGALTEAILKINDATNRTGKLPKNGIWTVVCQEVGERLLEKSKKM